MSIQPALIVDSRAARREFTQCQMCGKDKEHFKIKLSVCTGCRIATYCSSKCQRDNWPAHKQLCLQRRKTNEQTADMDRTVKDHNPLTHPLPSELIAELRSFTQKFNPVIFQAGINIMHMGRHLWQDVWRELVLMIFLSRLPDIQENSRPWARFKVDHVLPVPTDYVMNYTGGDDSFVQLRREREEENLANGYTGTITAMICTGCDSSDPPKMLHNVTFYGFGPHSFVAVELTPEWQKSFTENVEKMCGRPATELEASSST
ncbi:hypothetical protein BDY19DRAFT_938332 [Irpex rosettiformis]|uniref:Uncharacterized protein n=1 Tax=Irpex rosettiformis TaxID=378272 RepID=A0ACB8U6S5_9APHY|nr:hypothetical protein BDY19DRAFT_938332 [Irpex rosettiformis]